MPAKTDKPDKTVQRMTIYLILFLILLLAAGGIYFSSTYNARVAKELKSSPQGERAAQVMLITFPDGRSIPVNYLKEGNTVFAGSDFNWWKKIASDGTSLKILIKGEEFEGIATVSDDMAYTYEVFKRLRPNAPAWASRLVGAKLVIIRLVDQY